MQTTLVCISAEPAGYENRFALSQPTITLNGFYTTTLSLINSISRNNLGSTEGIVTVYIEVKYGVRCQIDLYLYVVMLKMII